MLMDARPLVEERIEKIKKITDLMEVKPKLVIIRVGDDTASIKYVNNKVKLCERAGVDSEVIVLPESTNEEAVEYEIKRLNIEPKVSGILLQLPLPKHLNESKLTQLICEKKDVDGFRDVNLGKLVLGEYSPRACTPTGIMSLLDFYGVQLEGKDVLIINRSNIVGKPLALMLLEKNATVTIAHSKTKDLKEKCKKADIVVTAVGRANFLGAEDFKDDAVVVDVSINVDSNGKLCGDVTKSDYDKINMITPVPFGVGQTTVLSLIEQTVSMHSSGKVR